MRDGRNNPSNPIISRMDEWSAPAMVKLHLAWVRAGPFDIHLGLFRLSRIVRIVRIFLSRIFPILRKDAAFGKLAQRFLAPTPKA